MPEWLPDYRDSPWLRFEGGFAFKGDPENTEDFAQALDILETITSHFMEFGPWQEKTTVDLSEDLSYHNAWGRHEAGASYRETTLDQLQAISLRRIRAMEETGWQFTPSYIVASTLDRLIEQALTADEVLNRFMQQINQICSCSLKS